LTSFSTSKFKTGNLMNYIIGVIKQAEFAIANSPMSKMMGQRRG